MFLMYDSKNIFFKYNNENKFWNTLFKYLYYLEIKEE